jgi:DNA-binding CsgD family transcriptional regulator
MHSKTAEAAMLADTLDGLGAGLILVDAGGRIVHANAAGHVLLAAGDVLGAVEGILAAGDPEANQLLCEVFAAAGTSDACSAKAIAVPFVAPGGGRYVVHVLPLASGVRRRAGASYPAVAALLVHRAALDTRATVNVIARAFRLTPRELRVLLGIVEAGGVPETAEALGIAETTVKTHLRRLYAKTATSRQADLVKLVAGYSSPLVG